MPPTFELAFSPTAPGAGVDSEAAKSRGEVVSAWKEPSLS